MYIVSSYEYASKIHGCLSSGSTHDMVQFVEENCSKYFCRYQGEKSVKLNKHGKDSTIIRAIGTNDSTIIQFPEIFSNSEWTKCKSARKYL